MAGHAVARRARAGDRLLHGDSPQRPGAAKPFAIVPYNLEYQGELAEAARLLREAAAQTTQPTLKKFLDKRADAFLTNDYYAATSRGWSWMRRSSRPSARTRFTRTSGSTTRLRSKSFITIRDDAESDKLARSAPSCRRSRTTCRSTRRSAIRSSGALAPIRVVNVVFTAGDGNRGVQTAAYNLPNDERVVREKGTKRVMLKNMQEAKFPVVLKPIARVALAAADQSRVDVRRVLHAHPHARADARPGPA